MTDPIADFLTHLKNATRIRKKMVTMPYSKVKHAIADVLVKYRYINDAKQEEAKPFPLLRITLSEDRGPLEIKRISKPGQRIYFRVHQIRRIRQGFGLGILSTPQGIMSNVDAKKKKLGGEMLCEIYEK